MKYLESSLSEDTSDAEYMDFYASALADIEDTDEKRQAYVDEPKAKGDWDR